MRSCQATFPSSLTIVTHKTVKQHRSVRQLSPLLYYIWVGYSVISLLVIWTLTITTFGMLLQLAYHHFLIGGTISNGLSSDLRNLLHSCRLQRSTSKYEIAIGDCRSCFPAFFPLKFRSEKTFHSCYKCLLRTRWRQK